MACRNCSCWWREQRKAPYMSRCMLLQQQSSTGSGGLDCLYIMEPTGLSLRTYSAITPVCVIFSSFLSAYRVLEWGLPPFHQTPSKKPTVNQERERMSRYMSVRVCVDDVEWDWNKIEGWRFTRDNVSSLGEPLYLLRSQPIRSKWLEVMAVGNASVLQ